MTKTRKPDFQIVRRQTAVIPLALLAALYGQPLAHAAQPSSGMATQVAFYGQQGPMAGHSVITSRGSAFVTGNLGSLETTTLPGRGGQGLLLNNGNGTSTLLVPGGVPQTVATPR